MNKSKIMIAGVCMALAVALGAFAAHGLKDTLSEYSTDIWKTANFYHFIHGLGLWLIVLSERAGYLQKANAVFYSMLGGIVLFSASLYLLALRDVFPALPKWLGAITPLGGLLFILSWMLLSFYFFEKKSDKLL